MHAESRTPCFQFKPKKDFWNHKIKQQDFIKQKSIVTFCCKYFHINFLTYEKQIFSILIIVIYRPANLQDFSQIFRFLRKLLGNSLGCDNNEVKISPLVKPFKAVFTNI